MARDVGEFSQPFGMQRNKLWPLDFGITHLIKTNLFGLLLSGINIMEVFRVNEMPPE
jgi:hypothetical protein